MQSTELVTGNTKTSKAQSLSFRSVLFLSETDLYSDKLPRSMASAVISVNRLPRSSVLEPRSEKRAGTEGTRVTKEVFILVISCGCRKGGVSPRTPRSFCNRAGDPHGTDSCATPPRGHPAARPAALLWL